MWAKQSTAATFIVGPILDSTGAEYSSAVIGDLSISKNGGTLTAMAAAATLTHIANGQYTLVTTTGNMDTLGRAQITVNRSTYQMPPLNLNIVPANVFDSLVLGTDTLQSDAIEISGDSDAADNLELMFDGTGYTDETAPASRAQVDGIGSGSGGSIPFEAIEDNTGGAIIDGVTFVGSVSSGTFANTASEDGTSHEINDTANDIDIVYGFQVGGGRVGTSVQISANVNGNTDEMKVKAYDHVGGDWEIIGTIEGSSSSTFKVIEPALFQKFTGTGSELGKVYIRFDTDSTTPTSLAVDQCVVLAANIGQTIGYANGSVWCDTNGSNTNTESFVDGVADNPVSTLAAAITIAQAVGLARITFAAGSSVTLAGDMSNYELLGQNWTLAFGGQTVTGANICGATVSGTFVGTTCILENCTINAITGPGITMRFCYLNEVSMTANGAGDWYLNDCRSRVSGTSSPTFDFGAGVGNTGLNMRNYSGGITLENLGDTGTDTATVEGNGAVTLNANCDGGTLAIRGGIRVTDNSGNVTLQITPEVSGYQEGAVWVDETSGTSSGMTVGIDGTFQNQSDDFDNAQDIADALGTKLLVIKPGNSITLTDTLQGFNIGNVQATLNGGSQNVDSTRINGGFLTGTFSRAGTGVPTFSNCNLNNVTSDRVACLNNCGILGTFTLSEAGVYVFNDAQAAGATSLATLDFASLGGATASFQRWSGDLTVNNMASGDTLRLHCSSGGDITLNGADATVNITGVVGAVTNNLTGSPTVTNNSTSPALIRAEIDSNSTQLADIVNLLQSLGANSIGNVVRGTDDETPVSFTWPVSGAAAALAANSTVSIDDGATFVPITGAITYVGQVAGHHWYQIAYDEDDRPAAAGVAWYVLNDTTYTKEFSLTIATTGGGGGGSDPLLNQVPGSYSPGTAGYIIGSIGSVTFTYNPAVIVDGSTIVIKAGDLNTFTLTSDTADVVPDLSTATALRFGIWAGNMQLVETTSVTVLVATGLQSVTVTVLPVETRHLTSQEAKWDLQAEYSDGDHRTLISGVADIISDYSGA